MTAQTIWDIDILMQQLTTHALPHEAAKRARALLTQLDGADAQRLPNVTNRILDAYAQVIRRSESREA